MNNNYVKLLNNLQNLKLEQIKDNLDKYLDLINENKKDIIDSLYELTTLEINLKQEKAMNACVRVANFPFLKTLHKIEKNLLNIQQTLVIIYYSKFTRTNNNHSNLSIPSILSKFTKFLYILNML